MLQFIFGRSGFGKTYTARKILATKSRTGCDKLMLLVPEQYSFENEKDMINILGPKASVVLETVSFTRLCDIVSRKVGGFAGIRLNDGGRNLIMSLAINAVQPKLKLYRKSAKKTEFIKLMTEALKEFRMCNISTEDLESCSHINMNDPILGEKLKETSLILSAYDAMIKGNYIDPIDDLTKLASILTTHNVFDGYTFVIDGFFGFTAQEMKVLECIISQASECYITMCTDKKLLASEHLTIYESVNKTVRTIEKFAKSHSIIIEDPIELKKSYRFCSNDLVALEKNLYTPKKQEYSGTVENITIYSANDIYDECHFIARTIKELIMTQPVRYRDFVIIARDLGQYDSIIESILQKYSIPYFIDTVHDICTKPLIRFILTAFDIITSGFKTEYILRLLKTNLLTLNFEDISLLENYVLLWDITGPDWLTDFTSNPNGFCIDKNPDETKMQLLLINNIRQSIITPLLNFNEKIKNSTGNAISKAIYELLNIMQISDTIMMSSTELSNGEDLRLWDMIMDILDQMNLVLKNQYLSPKQYKDLLELMIKSSDIAFIPAGIDEVKVGTADRMRPDHPRVVFVIGATQGDFPKTPSSSGLFNNSQRKKLIESGLNMYDSLENLSLWERFIAYTALTCTCEKLYISYPSLNISGNALQPSSIVFETETIFPNVKKIHYKDIKNSDKAYSKQTAFELCAKLWNDNSDFAKSLKKYFHENSNYSSQIDLIEKSTSLSHKKLESSEITHALFGNDLKVSASQIEKFYTCKFQYFCQYALRAKPRKKASLDALEYGNIIHYTLEKVLETNPKPSDLPDMIRKTLLSYINTRMGGLDNKPARFKYLFSRLSVASNELLLHVLNELNQSKFKPIDYELTIKSGQDIEPLVLKLPNGNSICVEGKVDRVDIMENDDIKYLRIIDYKTGAKQFKLSDVLHGINMQMLIYLAAIRANCKNRYGSIIPAGVLYMPASLPIINTVHDNPQNILNQQTEKFRMNGIIINDSDIIYGMEKDAKGIFIPVTMKNGKPNKTDSLMSLSEMGSLLEKTEELVISMVDSINNGDFDANPYPSAAHDVCEFCDYSSICLKNK